MANQRNARLIGAFVLGGMLLAVAAVTIIGGLRIFRDKELVVVYFDGSVNGLGVGSPVKFKGIEIGRVESLSLNFASPTGDLSSFRIPVVLEIFPDILESRGVAIDIHDQATRERLIDAGLRATLAVESFVTGVLYVSLDFQDNPGPPSYFAEPEFPWPEIPTGSTTMEAVQANVSRIVERLAAADVPLLIDSITVMAGALSRAAGNLNTREILGSIETTLLTVDRALGRLTTIADSVAASMGPVMAQFDSTTRAVRGTLDAATNALGDFDPAAIAESPAMIRTEEAMLELTRAARAFRELAQAIERNPSILLRGREGGVR